MKAVVPAAGEGTRLGPLTADRPKGLVEVADQPLLAHVFDSLVHLDVGEIVLVIGYEGEQIRDTFGESYREIPLDYVEQTDQLGLAHAIFQARDRIEHPFIVLNGDNIFADPLEQLREPGDADGILLVERAAPDEASETGVVDLDNGTVLGVVEKPDDPPSGWITTGAYLLPPAIMEAVVAISPSARGEYELADAIDLLLDRGYQFEAREFAGWRWNVNSPDDIERVERELLR